MISQELIAGLKADPSKIEQLGPRHFEELVAELLASMGWEVSLTPTSRDGGHDILAISRDRPGFETTWAVECKRYPSGRPVGLETLRALYGVKELLRIPQALLVTTSLSTRSATEFASRVSGLQIADRSVVERWLAEYEVSTRGLSHTEEKRFRSCFVSHSHRDDAFVLKMVNVLRDAGVRVWYAPEDLLPGKKIHEEVSKAIDRFDRLLLVLSEHSMTSNWVRTEVRRAREREIAENARVFFPISLVAFEKLREWSLFDADSGQDLAAEIREYFIPDFSRWTDQRLFEQQIEILLKGLEEA